MTGLRQHFTTLTGLRFLPFAAITIGSLATSGCMHRRMTIVTDPPGAQVLLDGREQGRSPVSVDFNYYGTREITLIKDGYETRTVMQKVRTPWYQITPFDLISDNFLPFKVTNRHNFLYRMQPQQHRTEQELLNNGNALRSASHVGP